MTVLIPLAATLGTPTAAMSASTAAFAAEFLRYDHSNVPILTTTVVAATTAHSGCAGDDRRTRCRSSRWGTRSFTTATNETLKTTAPTTVAATARKSTEVIGCVGRGVSADVTDRMACGRCDAVDGVSAVVGSTINALTTADSFTAPLLLTAALLYGV